MKELQEIFQKDRPKIESESFFVAKRSNESHTGLANATRGC